MKNSVELRQERADLIESANGMLELCKTEERDFTPEEQTSYDEKMNAIDKLANDIKMVERQEKLNAEIAANSGVAPVTSPKEVREYSFFKAVNGMIEGNLDGVEKEMHQEAINEARSAGTTINGLGIPSFMLEKRAIVPQGATGAATNIAATAVGGYVEALREASVFEQAGATILSGLSSNVKIPVVGSQSVEWEGENDTNADGGANFSSVTLDPTRVSSYVDLSKQILLQNGSGAEAAIIRDLGRAVGEKINAAMFADANVTGAPGCIAAVSGVGSITEGTYADNASVAADLLAMEQALAEAKGLKGNLAYVTHPAVMADLRQSPLVSSVNAAYDGNNFAGYPLHYTTGATKDAVGKDVQAIFGDFSNLYVGLFGGLDIMVDPYTQAGKAAIRLVLNQYVDWAVAQPAAFVAANPKYSA